MQKVEIMSCEAVTLWCYPQLRLLHHEMHGFCRSHWLRKMLMAGVRAMREHGAVGWLSDDRNNAAISPEDEVWGQTQWYPRVRSAGWRYWALVVPESPVGQLCMRRQTELFTTRGVKARMFTDVESAFGWLNRSISGSSWPAANHTSDAAVARAPIPKELA